MTVPRQILEGETLLVTRRCTRREFRLRPDPATCHIIEYCIAHAAAQHHIVVHEFVVMSNHYHIVLTDRFRRRAAFFCNLNSLIARAVNAQFGDWENLFAPGSYNCVKLISGRDVADKAAYTLLNPTAAGLVKLPEYWEGVTSWSMRYGRAKRIPRPSKFFGEGMPKVVELKVTRPSAVHPSLNDDDARDQLLSDVKQRARELAAAFRERGGSFMGMRRVRAQPRHSSPHTRAPRRGLRPTVAAKDKSERIEALNARRRFLAKYRAAWRAWREGNRQVAFPLGTFLMRDRFGVTVAKN